MGAGRPLLSVLKGQELVDGTTRGTQAGAEDIRTYSQQPGLGAVGRLLEGESGAWKAPLHFSY